MIDKNFGVSEEKAKAIYSTYRNILILASFQLHLNVSLPLHSMGTPDFLQARGREAARVRFMGARKASPPMIIRHKQSLPLLMRDFSESQQLAVGELPDPPAR